MSSNRSTPPLMEWQFSLETHAHNYEFRVRTRDMICSLTISESSSTTQQHHVAIHIEELNTSMEVAAEKEECRYCQEEGFVSELEAPCSCSGSLKYAHRKCVAHWCNIKRNTICEICKEPYSPNYSVTAPPPPIDIEDEIPMSERLRIPGTNIRILTPIQLIEVGTNRLLRSMNSDFTLRNPSFGVVFGTALLFFLAVLILRDDGFSHILYIVVVIIVAPIYILSWIMDFRAQLQRRREREMERDFTV